MRLFVSVDLPGDLAEAVAAVQREFEDASGLRFTDPRQAHVTLKFLGEVDAADVDALRADVARAVADAGVAPFEVTYGGLGVFPSEEYIRVLWLGVRDGAGDAELTALQEAVEARLVARGFDPADHEFTPHVTLARMEHAGGKALVQRKLRELDPTVGTARVDAVCLTESDLGEDGPEYATVHRAPLPDDP
ncbi:MAG: RNA 2',3'-cyclic phosphodiesterase [Halobacteriaceae archaeon]